MLGSSRCRTPSSASGRYLLSHPQHVRSGFFGCRGNRPIDVGSGKFVFERQGPGEENIVFEMDVAVEVRLKTRQFPITEAIRRPPVGRYRVIAGQLSQLRQELSSLTVVLLP